MQKHIITEVPQEINPFFKIFFPNLPQSPLLGLPTPGALAVKGDFSQISPADSKCRKNAQFVKARRLLSQVVMSTPPHPKLHHPTGGALWITHVDNSVENVENPEFSTIIRLPVMHSSPARSPGNSSLKWGFPPPPVPLRHRRHPAFFPAKGALQLAFVGFFRGALGGRIGPCLTNFVKNRQRASPFVKTRNGRGSVCLVQTPTSPSHASCRLVLLGIWYHAFLLRRIGCPELLGQIDFDQHLYQTHGTHQGSGMGVGTVCLLLILSS